MPIIFFKKAYNKLIAKKPQKFPITFKTLRNCQWYWLSQLGCDLLMVTLSPTQLTDLCHTREEEKFFHPSRFLRLLEELNWHETDQQEKIKVSVQFISSVQFSRSVLSDSLRPHGLQHARPLCPSPTPGVYPNSCPLSRWCHPTISSSIIPFSSCLLSFPASGSFQMSQLFASSGQSIGDSASASVFLMNTQGLISFIKQSLMTWIHGRDR